MCSTFLAICDETLLSVRNGTFQTPPSPVGFSGPRDCKWTYSVPAGEYAIVWFDNFTLDDAGSCENNYLKIYDGPDAKADLFGTFCNGNVPASFKTTTEDLYVEFKTDGTQARPEFMGHFSIGTKRTAY